MVIVINDTNEADVNDIDLVNRELISSRFILHLYTVGYRRSSD